MRPGTVLASAFVFYLVAWYGVGHMSGHAETSKAAGERNGGVLEEELVERDQSGEIVAVTYAHGVNREQAAAIIALPRLQRLKVPLVAGGPFGPEMLGRLVTHELVDLDLSFSQISNDDLKHVARYSGLRRLRLASTSISDAGLSHLQALSRLEFLDLEGTNVAGVGLAKLRCHKSLTRLVVTGEAVSDEGVAAVSRFGALEKLIVAGPKITEDGLRRLLALRKLQSIMIGDVHPAPYQVMRDLSVQIGCYVVYTYTLESDGKAGPKTGGTENGTGPKTGHH